MNSTGKLKIGIMAAAIVLACGTAEAQHRHWHSHPHRVVTVVSRPAVTVHIDNRFNQKERFKMAMAYLKDHRYLTVKKYAKITKLPKEAAEAELNAFALDRDKPIRAVVKGKKKVYVMHKNHRPGWAMTE